LCKARGRERATLTDKDEGRRRALPAEPAQGTGNLWNVG
jgi:hypothetical protein